MRSLSRGRLDRVSRTVRFACSSRTAMNTSHAALGALRLASIDCVCLPKMLSGANAFEISDIQEDEAEDSLIRRSECYIALKTAWNFGAPQANFSPTRFLSVVLNSGDVPARSLQIPTCLCQTVRIVLQ